MHDDLMAVKQWLLRYLQVWEEIDDLSARRNVLIQRAEAAHTTSFDGMPKGKGTHADPTGILVAHIEDINAEIAERITEARALYNEIDGTIKRIKGRGSADMHCCLQTRYLDGCSWPEVAQILFERKPDFEEKLDNYLRRTHFIHAKALEALSDFLHL